MKRISNLGQWIMRNFTYLLCIGLWSGSVQAQMVLIENVEVSGKLNTLVSAHSLAYPEGSVVLTLEGVTLAGTYGANSIPYACNGNQLSISADANGGDSPMGVEAKLKMLLFAHTQDKDVTVTYKVKAFGWMWAVAILCYVEEVKVLS